MRDRHTGRVAEHRVEKALADAAEFFESYLWESANSRAAHDTLAKENLDDEVIRAFGVGYAPIGHDELMSYLRDRGSRPSSWLEPGWQPVPYAGASTSASARESCSRSRAERAASSASPISAPTLAPPGRSG